MLSACEFIHAPIILVVLKKGEGFFKPSDQGHACFWVCFLDGSENKATTHRFNLDLGRNRSVVNGDSDKSWFTDNTGLPNCWNMQKAIIKEFYTKERKLSLYTPIEDINVLIKWYIGSDVAKWELGIITECGLVICLLWRAF